MFGNKPDNPTSLPFAEAADLWVELSDAYFSRNGFGTDTAEIYGYRLRGVDARTDVTRDNSCNTKAGENLHALVTAFREAHPSDVSIDGIQFGDWVKNQSIDHRTHVRVVPSQSY